MCCMIYTVYYEFLKNSKTNSAACDIKQNLKWALKEMAICQSQTRLSAGFVRPKRNIKVPSFTKQKVASSSAFID
jgi:hypothetical protein